MRERGTRMGQSKLLQSLLVGVASVPFQVVLGSKFIADWYTNAMTPIFVVVFAVFVGVLYWVATEFRIF